MGASVYWPNKDTQAEEPDSQRVAFTVPDPMLDVANGRLRGTTRNSDGTTTYEWFVANPINNYAIAVAAGSYAHYGEFTRERMVPLRSISIRSTITSPPPSASGSRPSRCWPASSTGLVRIHGTGTGTS
jgi:hypothetical protein